MLVVALASAVASAATSVTARMGARPTTLAAVRGRIGGFAQDGDRVAWLWPTTSCRDFVQLRELSSGKQVRLAAPRGATCPAADAYLQGAIAIAGDHAIWVVYDEFGGNTVVEYRVYVVEGRVGKRDRVIARYEYEESKDDYGNAALPAVPMAGDGGTLAYVFGGSVRRVVSGRSVPIPGVARPEVFALSASRLAVASTTFVGGCVCNRGPAWSPDGSTLSFTSGRDGGGPRVFVMSVAGAAPKAIADGIAAGWSPNGRKIAFLRSPSDEVDLVVVDADGSNEIVVPNAYDWAWSPDSSRLAFASNGDIHVIGVDGKGDRIVANGAYAPAWSPDGTKIAFLGSLPTGNDVEVVNPDGTGRHAIASGSETAAAWSPDGAKLLFAHDGALQVVLADGTGLTQLTHPDKGLLDTAESWSPDGRMIVFERGRYDPDTDRFVQPRLWMMNADGSGPHRLTSGNADETDPAWSPDGAKIALARGGELYVVRADGAGETRLTTTHPAEPRSTGGIFAAASGQKLSAFETVGKVRAVALSPTVLAVLVDGFFGTRIELLDPRTGTARGGVSVAAPVAAVLSAAGTRIVFSVGRKIMLLDATRRRLTELTVAASAPIGLSIEGRRVAWAENVGGQGRVRALMAP